MTETDTAFTLVFEGDLREFDRNPMKIESKFGKCVAAHVGDALQELDDSASEITRLTAALAEAEGRLVMADGVVTLERGLGIDTHAWMLKVARQAVAKQIELEKSLTAANARIAELENALDGVVSQWDRFEAEELQTDEGVEQAIERARSVLKEARDG